MYVVRYAIPFRHGEELRSVEASDLNACRCLLAETFERGFRVVDVQCDGIALIPVELSRLLRGAAELLVQKHQAAM